MFKIFVIGCGGIGGNVARDLPKLLINSPNKLVLVDGDDVEKSNTIRQPYQTQDVNLNKARVLARKINSFYSTKTTYIDKYITDKELDEHIEEDYTTVLIGCVDNDSTRMILEKLFNRIENVIYIDGANSEYEGNVFVTKKEKGILYGQLRSNIYKLSDDINPGLLSCEDQVATGAMQYLITNNKVAASILEHMHYILSNQIKIGVTKIERFKTVHY